MRWVNSFPWAAHPEAVDRMVALADTGLAAGQIAGAMSKEYGVHLSRSAVLGKIHRHHLEGHLHHRPAEKRDNRANPPQRAKRKPKPHLPALTHASVGRLQRKHEEPLLEPLPDPETVTSTSCGLLALTSETCRWPVGEATGHQQAFCGAPPLDGSPYCPGHTRMSYRPVAALRWTEKRAGSRWGATGPIA